MKKNTDVRILAALAAELGAVEIFVGLPRTMKGEEHASARMATEYAQLLAGALQDAGSDVPVRLVDERLSTVTRPPQPARSWHEQQESPYSG